MRMIKTVNSGRVLKLFSTLLLCMMALVSCGEDEPTPTPTPDPDPVEPTPAAVFTVEVGNITATSAEVTVTPSDPEAVYFASVVLASELSELDDDAVIAKMVAAEDFPEKLHKDVLSLTAENLASSSNYTVLVFEYVKGKSGALNKTSFVTSAPSETSRNITISNLTAGYTDVAFRVQPDLLDTPWFYVAMEKEYYDKYVAQEGDTGPMVRAYYMLQNTAVDQSMNIGQYLSLVRLYGAGDVVIKNLKPACEYVVMVFYVNPNETNPTVIYDYYYAKADVTTRTPEGAGAKVLDVKSNVTRASGVVTISVNVKAANVADGKYKLGYKADYPEEVFDLNDPQSAYTIATLLGKSINSSQAEALNSAEGYTFEWQLSEDDLDYFVFGIYVADEQGAGEAKAIAINPF